MLHVRFWRAVAAAFLAALAAFLLTGRIDAISIGLQLSELSAASPLVVQGRVERIESAWNANREIESTVYVRVNDVPRGQLSPGALIPVRVRGGRVDGLTMVSEEEATFDNGENVYLFLAVLNGSAGPNGDAYRVTAGRQGKFDVVGDRVINRAWQADFRLADLQKGVIEGRWPAEPASYGTPSPSDSATGAEAAATGALAGAQPDSYVYNNVKWFGPNPMEETYLINVNTGDAGGANGAVDAFRDAIISAANTWGNAGAAFSFKYGGTSNIATTGYDDKNVIHWENMGNTPTLAEATWWKYDNGQIVEADIRFNDYYAWDVTGAPSGSEPDLQSIATHELGHWLSLAHDTDSACPNSTAVMCASYMMGTLKRTLSANDVAGIRSIYGQSSPTPTATPTWTPTPTSTPTRTPVPTLDPRKVNSRIYLPMIARPR